MIISVFNQKGGVAKTTTACNLGSYLARHGKKVLLVDMDAQANLTVSVGLNEEDLEATIFDLIDEQEFNEEKVREVVQETEYPRLHILPSDISLSNAELTLSNVMSRETVLKRILATLKEHYDFIIIDCPPSLGLLSVNSLVASDYLIVPATPQFFSMKGIKHLIDTIKLVKENLNPKLELMGVLITMYNARKTIAKDIRETLLQVFGDKVFNTVIRNDAKVEYSQDSQTPLIHFHEKCNAYKDYLEFGKEVLAWDRETTKVEA